MFLCFVNFSVSLFVQVAHQYEPAVLLVFGSGGAILSQVALLGFLLINLPLGLIARIVAVLFQGMLFWLSLLVGAYLFAFMGLTILEDLAKMLPIFVIALATPFAAAKHFLGWKIQFAELTQQRNSQMGTVSLLTATGLVAISMAILSSGNQEAVLPAFSGTAVCLLLSVAFLLPLARVVLGSKRPFYMIVAISIVTLFWARGLIWFIGRYSRPISVWAISGISLAAASFPFWFGIELLLFRRFGGKLVVQQQGGKAG